MFLHLPAWKTNRKSPDSMDALEFNSAEFDRRPKTLNVLVLLAIAAFVFSYLWAYCLTDALVAADMRAPLPRDGDPRPRWLVTGWLALTTVFALVGWLC